MLRLKCNVINGTSGEIRQKDFAIPESAQIKNKTNTLRYIARKSGYGDNSLLDDAIRYEVEVSLSDYLDETRKLLKANGVPGNWGEYGGVSAYFDYACDAAKAIDAILAIQY